MFNAALTYTAIRNFQKNLSKPIDKENEKVYNNNEDKERGNENMKEMEIRNIINLIMREEITISQLLFYVENVGYLHVDEIFLENEGVKVYNCETDIQEYFCFQGGKLWVNF